MLFSARQPLFDVRQDEPPSSTLLCGFSAYGLAGLTAVDYLVEQLDLEATGHVTTEELPAITPFAQGVPRHHTRLFSRDDLDVSVLVGELFVPRPAARGFADVVTDWAEAHAVDEICILSGVPVAHGPDEHRTYYVATEDFIEHRLGEQAGTAGTPDAGTETCDGGDSNGGDSNSGDSDGGTAEEAGQTDDGGEETGSIPPMAGGYLDGVNASLVERGLDSPLRVGLLTTPTHQQAPDVDAALRLLETANDLYDLDVDLAPLQSFADQVASHYEELAQRIQEVEEERPRQSEDRMYM